MSRELARRVEKLAVELEQLARRQVLALILERAECPAWAETISEGRCAYLIGGEPGHRAAGLEALRESAALPEGVIVHDYARKRGASRFIAEVVGGGDETANAAEVAGWGARGDRKTSAALDAWLIVADRHRAAGYPLPFRVMVPTGSMVEHTLKLCRTLVAPHWGSVWALTNDSHLATATVDGVALLALDLFGTSDPGALDRLRMECHAVWGEEVAPAALEGGGGVPEDAWSMGLTSMRLETPRKVAVVTSNYPDEDDWAWQRFVVSPHPGTVSVRIPAGESASAEDRERWAVSLKGRPDLFARLVAGEPGSVQQGPQVAKGFSLLVHVAKAPLPIERHLDWWLGWDSAPNAHTHAVIIGQRNGRFRRVFAGLVAQEIPFTRFLEGVVLPWFARRAPWVLERGGGEDLYHRYDPAMDDVEGVTWLPQSTRIRTALGGSLAPGAVDWPARSGPVLELLAEADPAGGPALMLDAGDDTMLLRRALASKWHYAVTRGGAVIRDLPAKPNHPWEDLGDAFAYWCGGVAPSVMRKSKATAWTGRSRGTFNVFDRRSWAGR